MPVKKGHAPMLSSRSILSLLLLVVGAVTCSGCVTQVKSSCNVGESAVLPSKVAKLKRTFLDDVQRGVVPGKQVGKLRSCVVSVGECAGMVNVHQATLPANAGELLLMFSKDTVETANYAVVVSVLTSRQRYEQVVTDRYLWGNDRWQLMPRGSIEVRPR
jgi:hypothetical protein